MEERGFVIGFDIGTSSGKVCILDEDGKFLGVEREDYPTQHPRDGWAEQDPTLWLPALGRACRRLLNRLNVSGDRALALSVTSAAHIGVLLGASKTPLRPAILWNDQRSQLEALELAQTFGAEIFALGNNWPSTTWTISHLKWVGRHEPNVWSQVRYVLPSKDYVGFQLTGGMATDPATAVSTLLFDAQSGQWSSQLCELVELPRSTLPAVIPIASKIGNLLRDQAHNLGLREGIPVFNGTLDSTAETFSAGVITEGDCVVRLGTAGGIHCITPSYHAHPKLISYPYPIAPFWLSQAGTSTCGAAVAWASQAFSTNGIGSADFQFLSRLAEESPVGSKGLLFHPYLAGERCPYWDGDLRASFIGLALSHSKSDLARAVYEGTAFALRDAADVLKKEGFSFDKIKLVGGGTKSKLWGKILCAVLDRPIAVKAHADSSVGAALFTLIGLGRLPSTGSLTDDSGPAGEETWLAPDSSWRDIYNEGFQKYLRVQRHLHAIYHDQ